MLVGEAPGGSEDRANKPFVGMAGALLTHVLNNLNIVEDDLYITNCLKCRPTDNTLPSPKQTVELYDRCRPYLEQEVRTIKPKVIVLLGGTALHLMAGQAQITKHEGMVLDMVWMGAKTVAAFHPAYVLRAPSKEVRLAQALATAWELAGHKVYTTAGDIYKYEVRA
jgi:DNA polymerase